MLKVRKSKDETGVKKVINCEQIYITFNEQSNGLAFHLSSFLTTVSPFSHLFQFEVHSLQYPFRFWKQKGVT